MAPSGNVLVVHEPPRHILIAHNYLRSENGIPTTQRKKVAANFLFLNEINREGAELRRSNAPVPLFGKNLEVTSECVVFFSRNKNLSSKYTPVIGRECRSAYETHIVCFFKIKSVLGRHHVHHAIRLRSTVAPRHRLFGPLDDKNQLADMGTEQIVDAFTHGERAMAIRLIKPTIYEALKPSLTFFGGHRVLPLLVKYLGRV